MDLGEDAEEIAAEDLVDGIGGNSAGEQGTGEVGEVGGGGHVLGGVRDAVEV